MNNRTKSLTILGLILGLTGLAYIAVYALVGYIFAVPTCTGTAGADEHLATDTLCDAVGLTTVNSLAGNDFFDNTGATWAAAATVNGDAGDDTLILATAVAAGVTLNGGDGSDTLLVTAAACTAATCTADGGAGNDSIRNTTAAGVATLNGGAANDFITAGGAGDTIDGGAGNDIINGGAGADTINGSAGNDTIRGGAGADVLIGGTGNDNMNDGPGADGTFFGLDGNDRLELVGDGAVDTLNAGAGNDLIIINAGSVPAAGTEDITCGAGRDTVALRGFPAATPLIFPITDPSTGGTYTNLTGDCESVVFARF